MAHWICSFIFKMFGWTWEVPDISKTPKVMIAVVPHTSYWDFPIGILLRPVLHMDIKFLAKQSIFRPPFGWIFRAMGGYPVDRTGNMNFVNTVIKLIDSKEEILICMAPEGTRKSVDRLKSGFYYIALGAKIPIMLCKFDWEKRVVGFSEAFWPSGNYQEDLKKLEEYFGGAKGKIPEHGWQRDKKMSE